VNFASLATSSFNTGAYTVTRRGPTTSVGGRATLAGSSTFTIQASVQALSGRDLQRLPEGMRVQELRKLYTPTQLQAIGAPDVVSIDGSSWEVQTVEDWSGLGNFFKVIVQRVGD